MDKSLSFSERGLSHPPEIQLSMTWRYFHTGLTDLGWWSVGLGVGSSSGCPSVCWSLWRPWPGQPGIGPLSPSAFALRVDSKRFASSGPACPSSVGLRRQRKFISHSNLIPYKIRTSIFLNHSNSSPISSCSFSNWSATTSPSTVIMVTGPEVMSLTPEEVTFWDPLEVMVPFLLLLVLFALRSSWTLRLVTTVVPLDVLAVPFNDDLLVYSRLFKFYWI